MPTLREMFPRKYLSMHDFAEGELVTVTVKAFTLEAATIRPAAYGRSSQQAISDPKWLIWFHEYPKPMEGRPGRVARLLASLGVESTEEAVGKRVCIYRGKTQIGNEMVEGLLVDERPVQQLPPAKDKALLVAKIDGKVPRANIDRALEHMKKAGKSWDDFLKWCKDHSPEALALAWGVDLDSVPAAIVPAIKTYLDELAAPPAEGKPGHPSYRDLASNSSIGRAPPEEPRHRPPPPDIEEADIPF